MHLTFRLVLLLAVAGSAYACVSDALMRSLSLYPATGSAFCTQYIRSTSTETLISTTTITSVEATVTPKTTVIQTITTFITVTVQETTTSTTALYPAPIKARSVFVPPYLSTFAPYQLSSGCSCFVSPLPTPVTTVVETVYTRVIPATTTAPTLTLTTFSTLTKTSTTTQVLTTVVPNCAPINGCILPNSSWSNVAWEYSQPQPVFCEDYCLGIGGCLGWQLGPANNATGSPPTCNILGLAAWRAWDPTPAAVGVAKGVGGGADCGTYWIYERSCPYVAGYPAI
ncbi:uncharacterized protein PAC_19565 [Phialocephala subalpina]|uniref:Apple domain-containing protein n=1 Tax=Phialocephala subalpina TaxID=576137 RepID=A0A1L7XXL7_9HELO|nr:uncharacterized protein PAC_19565 [Phialocephala subalpina]